MRRYIGVDYHKGYSYRTLMARIDFGNQPSPADQGNRGIPWKVSMARAKEDFRFSVLPLEKAVLIHINDARIESGLEPIYVLSINVCVSLAYQR